MTTAVSLAGLTYLVGMTALWGVAAGAEVGGVVGCFVLTVTGGLAALAALAFAPGIRRLTVPGRLFLTGLLACPVATGFAVAAWVQVF
ncbi:hypothetical protein ACFXOD_34450 [Streptomyces sp. NPDC059161]|uniref:hypothetical protein n=1 Tax=Streptomyces sp. NPDC059161 TaxID=3346749 RepID=UPI0036A842E1